MSEQQKPTAKKDADLLTDAESDAVSGGFQPQPEPPGRPSRIGTPPGVQVDPGEVINEGSSLRKP